MRIAVVASGACVVGAVLFGVHVDLAAPAGADPTDDAFIQQLDSRGLRYSSPADAIENARGVCSRLGSGLDVAAQYLQANTGYSNDQMMAFGGAAVQAYCPDMGSKL